MSRIINYIAQHPFRSLAISYVLVVTATYSLTRDTARPKGPEASIVKVLNLAGTGGGTGWVTKAKGKNVIVTNDHVCAVEMGGYVIIQTDDGRLGRKKVLKRSAVRDLCIVEGLRAPALRIAPFGPRRFDKLTVYGHPLLKPTTPSTGEYLEDGVVPIGMGPNEEGNCQEGTEEIESFFGKICVLPMELSYSTVPIYPGNSGSPVLNEEGEVVGVMNSSDSRDNRGMFIPLQYLKEILE